MAIIRFSCVENKLYAPAGDGEFEGSLHGEGDRPDAGLLYIAEPETRPTGADTLRGYVTRNMDSVPEGGPVVFMVNGYEYDPTKPLRRDDPQQSNNPHARILHFNEYPLEEEHSNHSSGWPKRLGFSPERSANSGLAVAFGWYSDYGLHLDAYNAASDKVVWSLIAALDAVAEARPNQRIDLIAHSLGTHLVLQTIRRCAKLFPDLAVRLRRVILLGGSEFVTQAKKTYGWLGQRVAEAGNRPLSDFIEIYNVACWTDDVVGTVAQIATLGPNSEKKMIGKYGLEMGNHQPGWMDIQLDDDELQNWMQGSFALQVAGDRPSAWLDHWYYYTNPENTALYARILREGDAMSINNLRAAGIPEGVRSNS